MNSCRSVYRFEDCAARSLQIPAPRVWGRVRVGGECPRCAQDGRRGWAFTASPNFPLIELPLNLRELDAPTSPPPPPPTRPHRGGGGRHIEDRQISSCVH